MFIAHNTLREAVRQKVGGLMLGLALVLVLGTTGWFSTSRLVRGEVLRLKQEPFVTAALALGSNPWRTITRHLLPNAAGPVLVAATLGVGDVILLEAGLSFLGLGIQPPISSWGGMVLDARSAPQITGPAAIDGIGPTADWQGYWQKTDLTKRQAASWANGG